MILYLMKRRLKMDLVKNNMDFVDMFEQLLAEYTGFKYAVTTDCCSNAIMLAMEIQLQDNIPGFTKDSIILFPPRTYMSVPMTLINHGWNKIDFLPQYTWADKYELMWAENMFSSSQDSTHVFDAATDLHKDMFTDYSNEDLVCISFQQKKRLALGRGGAILLNDQNKYEKLKRMRYDGRNPKICDNDEITNTPDDIILGYHCYMEPDKAARGILLLNQLENMTKYAPKCCFNYADISKLPCFKPYVQCK